MKLPRGCGIDLYHRDSLESTYEELKRQSDANIPDPEEEGLESTYEELKLVLRYSPFVASSGLESTYEELKPK